MFRVCSGRYLPRVWKPLRPERERENMKTWPASLPFNCALSKKIYKLKETLLIFSVQLLRLGAFFYCLALLVKHITICSKIFVESVRVGGKQIKNSIKNPRTCLGCSHTHARIYICAYVIHTEEVGEGCVKVCIWWVCVCRCVWEVNVMRKTPIKVNHNCLAKDSIFNAFDAFYGCQNPLACRGLVACTVGWDELHQNFKLLNYCMLQFRNCFVEPKM